MQHKNRWPWAKEKHVSRTTQRDKIEFEENRWKKTKKKNENTYILYIDDKK